MSNDELRGHDALLEFVAEKLTSLTDMTLAAYLAKHNINTVADVKRITGTEDEDFCEYVLAGMVNTNSKEHLDYVTALCDHMGLTDDEVKLVIKCIVHNELLRSLTRLYRLNEYLNNYDINGALKALVAVERAVSNQQPLFEDTIRRIPDWMVNYE